ncbi:membrane dipeptidase [Wenzhouxiangella sp. EGI_FJ10305]|uniref:membrane dipeptidase n=1 Tax=Wenzhouxiangella sp. EGI_FJ10305 TaxID=3243768 RepID=UPI0035D9C242
MSRVPIAALLLTATVGTFGAETPESELPELERAHRLLERHVLIDGHNDVPWQVRERFDRRLSELDFAGDAATLEPPMHTDLPRLREGRVGAQFWSVYVDPDFSGDEELAAIAGDNMLRVLREAEAVSGRLRSERGPSEARYE